MKALSAIVPRRFFSVPSIGATRPTILVAKILKILALHRCQAGGRLSRSTLPLIIAAILLTPNIRGEDLPAIRWEAHGLDPSSRTLLRNYLHQSVEDGLVPGGVVILIHKGETVFRESFGYRDLENKLPFEITTPFHAASLSKSILSTLAVKLHAEGMLDLDEPIDLRLPAARRLRVKDSQSPTQMPTIRQCLHHTAGFEADEDKRGRPWLQFRGQSMTLAEAVEAELEIPMARQPGLRFEYSGIGYDIVGRIMELATGQLLDDVLQQQICQPLGMNHTTFHPEKSVERELARFYWRWRSDGRLNRQADPRIVPAGQYASVGGGIVTTADDLARFMLMHRSAGVVDGEQWIDQDLLKQQYLRQRPGAYYGLGFTLGSGDQDGIGTWILHTGSSGTMFWWDRQTDVVGVIVTQHRYSRGEKMPETQKRIAKDAVPWTDAMKSRCIDPVFGWRPLKKSSQINP